ncbi:unnamed protein product [Caenorhabditis angaria]|uniref:Uncharacterized protein n=1 Tax=Caenorhabditis angaria TaxID=860376 RepID=A0A9P1IPA8_9PELO|nr:unnamed protein product [Caenorhabditis angaria]
MQVSLSFFVFISIILCIFIEESKCLTMRQLFRKIRPRKTMKAPSFVPTSPAPPTIPSDSPSFVRSIGSVAGREIIPRRWTTGERIREVVLDENGIALPVRSTPNIGSILARKNGLTT